MRAIFIQTLKDEGLNFLRTGGYYYSSGYPNNRFTYGYWWSGTSNSARLSRALDTDPSYVNPQSNPRGSGFAIRCVVREG